MDNRDRKVLHNLVQNHGAPAVLDALAEAATADLRELRDTAPAGREKVLYRRLTSAWEAVTKLLKRYEWF